MTDHDNLHKADQVYFLYDPQPVRMLDVIYVGPVMIYAGLKGNFNPFVKWSLIGVGICTILYNGANFIINEKRAYDKRKSESTEELPSVPELKQIVDKLEKIQIDKKEESEDKSQEREAKDGEALAELSISNPYNIDLPAEILQMLQNPSGGLIKREKAKT